MEKHLETVFPVIPGLFYQGGWLGEWREAAVIYKINSFIDVAGFIPNPLPCRCAIFSSVPMKDNNTLPDLTVAYACASHGAALIKEHYKLLVCCIGGINRSAFMCGLILHKLGHDHGLQIVSMLRDANPDCLENSTFRYYLENIGY